MADAVVHACDLRTLTVQAERPEVQGHIVCGQTQICQTIIVSLYYLQMFDETQH